MSDDNRKQLRLTGAAPSKSPRVKGTLGLEGARSRLAASAASFPPWEILPACCLCWVRFEKGRFVAACRCLTAYEKEDQSWQDEGCEDADGGVDEERE